MCTSRKPDPARAPLTPAAFAVAAQQPLPAPPAPHVAEDDAATRFARIAALHDRYFDEVTDARAAIEKLLRRASAGRLELDDEPQLVRMRKFLHVAEAAICRHSASAPSCANADKVAIKIEQELPAVRAALAKYEAPPAAPAPAAAPAVAIPELTEARIEIARLGATCSELRDRVVAAEQRTEQQRSEVARVVEASAKARAGKG